MFQVTTLDMNDLPMTEDGKVDYSKDFFNKPTNLTVSGQLNGETYAMAHIVMFIHLVLLSVQKTPTRQDMQQSSG